MKIIALTGGIIALLFALGMLRRATESATRQYLRRSWRG